jgi:hypothetical protein
MPFEVKTIDDAAKIAQIIFYAVAGTVAILTYIAARRTLLNTVNTEYQKRVMDRLQKLGEDLYDEFNDQSPNFWVKNLPTQHLVEHANGEFAVYGQNGCKLCSTPVTSDLARLSKLLKGVVSDPFIPDAIREPTIDFLENRHAVLSEVYIDVTHEYYGALVEGTRKPIENPVLANKIHNDLIEEINKRGCGFHQVEKDIHAIRSQIQDYFESFNPHRNRWWHGQRKTKVRPGGNESEIEEK